MHSLPPGVKRVTVLRRSGLGSLHGAVVYEEKRKTRGSKRLRGIEKAMSRIVHERANASIIYLDRHRRSNEKKKDGWLKDLAKNVKVSTEKGKKHRKRLLSLKELRRSRAEEPSGARISAPVYRVTV